MTKKLMKMRCLDCKNILLAFGGNHHCKYYDRLCKQIENCKYYRDTKLKENKNGRTN